MKRETGIRETRRAANTLSPSWAATEPTSTKILIRTITIGHRTVPSSKSLSNVLASIFPQSHRMPITIIKRIGEKLPPPEPVFPLSGLALPPPGNGTGQDSTGLVVGPTSRDCAESAVAAKPPRDAPMMRSRIVGSSNRPSWESLVPALPMSFTQVTSQPPALGRLCCELARKVGDARATRLVAGFPSRRILAPSWNLGAKLQYYGMSSQSQTPVSRLGMRTAVHDPIGMYGVAAFAKGVLVQAPPSGRRPFPCSAVSH